MRGYAWSAPAWGYFVISDSLQSDDLWPTHMSALHTECIYNSSTADSHARFQSDYPFLHIPPCS